MNKLMDIYIPKKLWPFFVLIGVIIFLMLTLYLWSFALDDSFISFRYASHLAQGQGLVWNLNNMPVEGYSNFLWVLLSTIAMIIKIDPLLFTRLINSFSLIGIIAIFWNLSKDIFNDDKSSAYLSFSIGVLILLSNPATAIHFLSGLETFTYSFFILLSSFITFKTLKSKNSKYIWGFPVIGVLTGLLRPEGFLVVIGLFSLMFFYFKKYDNRQTFNVLKSFALFFLVPISLYMIFRFYYFNEIFPMPFLVKTMNYGGFNNFIHNFSLYYVIPILFVIASGLYYISREKIDLSYKILSIGSKYILYLIIVLVSITCANLIYINMSLIMNYAERFFYPSLLLLYILSSISVVLLIKNINLSFKNIKFTKSIGIIFVGLLIFSNVYFIPEIKYEESYSKGLNEAHMSLGRALEQYSDYNYTAVCIDVGAIPYYSKWNFIDLEGLTDEYIAKNHGVSYEYLAKKDPELIILVSGDGSSIDLYVAHNQKVPYDYVIQNNFTKFPPIKFNRKYYLIPFLKPGIKDYNKIVDTLDEVARNSNK